VNEPNSNPDYDLCGAIIGSAMKVHRKLGFGFLESVYNRALSNELTTAGHVVQNEIPIKVWYEGQVVGDFYADLVVDDQIIVELKAVERMIAAHEVQLVNYLTATNREEGLLLNFGTQSLEFKKKFRRPAAPKNNSVNSV
jgi:GxxExxY protein